MYLYRQHLYMYIVVECWWQAGAIQLVTVSANLDYLTTMKV